MAVLCVRNSPSEMQSNASMWIPFLSRSLFCGARAVLARSDPTGTWFREKGLKRFFFEGARNQGHF